MGTKKETDIRDGEVQLLLRALNSLHFRLLRIGRVALESSS